ncbi:hypothetical protein PMAYCL1PPCAC_27285, partial [Pristionchus mayeri]
LRHPPPCACNLLQFAIYDLFLQKIPNRYGPEIDDFPSRNLSTGSNGCFLRFVITQLMRMMMTTCRWSCTSAREKKNCFACVVSDADRESEACPPWND